ncbi:MAG: SRPBCC family protein [Actinomycetota bacterium]|nr:SRPBCC family protein [Actinomycetota bacterium]
MIASIDIAAPQQRVWEYIMDADRIDDWVTIVQSIDYADPGPVRTGYRMDQTLCIRGISFKVHWTLKHLDAPNYARWEGEGPARSRAVIEDRLSTRDGVSRFDYHNEFRTPLGALGAAASKAFVGGIPEKEANASLRRLKELLESTS